jgi:hypothetical protein
MAKGKAKEHNRKLEDLAVAQHRHWSRERAV